MSDLEKRVAAIEARLNLQRTPDGTPPSRILRIEGGLPGPINWAYAGVARWERDDGEELEAFVERAAQAALAAGEASLTVGGLPRSDELGKFANFAEWWATIAPYYPEVPPEEPIGSTRRW